MKDFLNKLIIIYLVIVFCPFAVLSEEADNTFDEDETGTVTICTSYINPVYSNQITEEDLKPLSDEIQVVSDKTYTEISNIASFVKTQMIARTETISFQYSTSDLIDSSAKLKAFTTDLMDIVYEHTGKPKEGDSIRWQNGGASTGLSYSTGGSTITYTFTMTFTYYDTVEQEAELDSAVNSLLNTLKPSGTEYEKITTIYDWICENITYDYDSSGTLKHTAYSAMIRKTAVCQGYALLFYRLMLEIGIDARLITGIGNGGAHGWNIVRIGEYYYNVDSTWDAVYKQYGYDYEYYLMSNDEFDDHTRDEEYETTDFNVEYPMSPQSYYLNLLESPQITSFSSNSDGIHLNWNSIENVSSYILLKECQDDGSVSEITLTRNSYDDNDVSGYNTYIYKVKAYYSNLGVYSLYGNEVSVCYDYLSDGLTISSNSLTINATKTKTLIANISNVIWSSSDKTIAKVSKGKITALKAGHAVITASTPDNKYSAQCTLFVRFTDVTSSSKYYYEPVYWALESGITTGTSDSTFEPNVNCTREQVVTFLWRMMGSPEPTTITDFTDCKSTKYYYNAVMWAAEQGITTGINDGTGRFGIGETCNREMVVTFLWRAAGQPEYTPTEETIFTDCKSDKYYYQAVAWAAGNGITTGLNDGSGKFGIGNACTRGMIVTFLQRYAQMNDENYTAEVPNLVAIFNNGDLTASQTSDSIITYFSDNNFTNYSVIIDDYGITPGTVYRQFPVPGRYYQKAIIRIYVQI